MNEVLLKMLAQFDLQPGQCQRVQVNGYHLEIRRPMEERADVTERDSGPNANALTEEEWSSALNDRRIELIDKDIQDNLTVEEQIELAELQRKAIAYRDLVAALPIEGARRLHQQLLEKKRERVGS